MRLALAMVTDQRGYRLARYAMASALLTQTDSYTPTLLLHGWDGPASDDGLLKLARRVGKPLELMRLDETAFDTHGLWTAAHISKTTYMKLAAFERLSQTYDHALYVDTDVLFYEPVSLGTIDFRGNPLAAVYDLADCNAIDQKHAPRHRPDRTHGGYFNAGLMAFDFQNHDIRSMRELYHLNCEKHQTYCPIYLDCACSDQCPFNLTFAGKWTPLPLTWNMQTFVLQTPAWRTAAVRHYTGAKKFLPIQALRADKRERSFIKQIAEALGDHQPREWPGMGLLYWANGIRRSRARTLAAAAVTVIEEKMQDGRTRHLAAQARYGATCDGDTLACR